MKAVALERSGACQTITMDEYERSRLLNKRKGLEEILASLLAMAPDSEFRAKKLKAVRFFPKSQNYLFFISVLAG